MLADLAEDRDRRARLTMRTIAARAASPIRTGYTTLPRDRFGTISDGRTGPAMRSVTAVFAAWRLSSPITSLRTPEPPQLTSMKQLQQTIRCRMSQKGRILYSISPREGAPTNVALAGRCPTPHVARPAHGAATNRPHVSRTGPALRSRHPSRTPMWRCARHTEHAHPAEAGNPAPDAAADSPRPRA